MKKIIITFAMLYFASAMVFATGQPEVIPDVNLKSRTTAVKKESGPATGTVTHFSSAEIADSPAVNLGELFRTQQSVVRLTNNSGDASQTALSLRGFGDNAAANSLILVDGFPLTHPSLLAPNFNSIPLTDIERIDIFQGSEGTLWGTQAVGGVVNIITRHPKKFFASGIVSLGSYGRNYYNVITGDKTDDGLFFKLFGQFGQTQNYRDHNKQSNNNLAALGGWDYARGTISLNAQTYTDTTYFPGGLSEVLFHSHPRLATNFNNYSRYRTTLLQLLNQHELNDQWLLETRAWRRQTRGDGFVFLNFNRYDAASTISQQLTGSIHKNKITTGYDAQASDYQLTNSKVNSTTAAKQFDVFFQDVYPAMDKLNVTVGARSAWQDNRIDTLLGRSVHSRNHVFVTEEGLSYKLNNQWSFYLRRDGNFSFPKASEETWAPADVGALKTQTGVSYEAGAEWNTEKLKTQMGIYRLALQDEIAFNPAQTVAQPLGSYENLDKTRRYGVTLTEDYRVTPRAFINGQLNYVDARFASGSYAGNLVPAVPAVNGNLGLTYDWTEHWQAQYRWLYTGNRYASEDLANVGKRLPAYWLNDIAVQYLLKSWLLSFEIHNLFNNHYPAYAYYNPAINANTYFPAAGRNFLLTVKLNVN